MAYTSAARKENKMANMMDRMIRAAKLDVSLYEEVEADRDAMGQAIAVVLLASLAAGIGNLARGGMMGLIGGALAALLSWYIWAYLTYFIGTRLLPEPQTHSTPGELLRTLGFASSPGLLRLLGIIPGLTGVVFVVVAVWMLIAMVIAVRQALDYTSTARAVGVCAIGWIAQAIILIPMLLWVGEVPEPS
jgi:hypothetical protein